MEYVAVEKEDGRNFAFEYVAVEKEYVAIEKEIQKHPHQVAILIPVSYTHLTLPTIYSV